MKNRTCLILLGLFSLPVIYPLTGGGYILTHDQYFPIHRLVALHHCLLEGQIPPRWTDLFALGYGYPFFNFYAPLAYYLAEIFFLITHHYIFSVHSVFAFGLIFGGFGVYFWLKNTFNENAALVGGIIYIHLPYHLVNAYVRGDISELMASSFFPWTLWSFNRLADGKNNKLWVIISGIFYACIMLSHNIMALLFTGFLCIYIAFLIYQYKTIALLWRSVFSLGLGLGLSVYFWLPAFIEKKYIQVGSLLNAAQYREHFIYPFQFISLYWGYGGSVAGPDDEMSFQLGIVSLVLSLASLLFIKMKVKKEIRRQVIFYWMVFLLCLFLMLPASRFVWDTGPLLHYTLFPWRFLSLIGIPLTFLASFAVSEISKKIDKNIFIIILCILPVLVISPYLKKRQIPFSNQMVERMNIWRTEITSKTFGTTMSNEYLPVGVRKMPNIPVKSIIQPESNYPINFTTVRYSSVYQKYKVDLIQSENIVFKIFYFPGWEVRIDGHPKNISITENGCISIQIPPGNHIVELEFKNTPIRQWANLLSLLGIMVLGGLLLFLILARSRQKN